MKNKLFLMISVIMACSLCACGQQEAGAMTNGLSKEYLQFILEQLSGLELQKIGKELKEL